MVSSNTKMFSRHLFLVALMLMSLFVFGCAATPQTEFQLEPPKHKAEDVLKDDVVYPIDIYDPLEGFNRRMYTFNYYFDRYLYLPIVNTYSYITPNYVEDRVSNFVDNVFEFNNFINNLLQLKFKQAGVTLGRFLTNTTIGVAGFWDPATKMGMLEQSEDFGQTLGHYNVGDGPYLVLPVLGPSNLRDTTGLITDGVLFSTVGPPEWVDDDDASFIFTGVSAVDQRHRQSFRYYQTGSPFEYEMIRMLYAEKRKLEIAK